MLHEWKTEKKGNETWRENPELLDAVLKFIDRLHKIALKQFEEFEALKEKILDEVKKGKNEIESSS